MRRPAAPPSPGPTTAVAAARPLLPQRVRPVARAVAVAAAVVAFALGVLLHGSSAPGAVDRPVTAWLRSVWPHPGHDAYVVDGLVTRVPILLTLVGLALLCLLAGRRRLAGLAVVGPCCVAATITLAKPLVDRTIHGDNLSYPSGHTGYATAVGVVVGLLLLALAHIRTRALATLLLLLPPLATGTFMAVDQVGIDAHYPSDTVGGICTALAVVLVLALLADRVLDRPTDRSRGAGVPHRGGRDRSGGRSGHDRG